MLAKKLILYELLRLHLKRKNDIKRKRLFVQQIFMVKELKLFDHKFFFKHIVTQRCDFSQRCFSLGFVF